MNQNESLLPLKIAVLTVSDTQTEADDKLGKILVDNLITIGHFDSRHRPCNLAQLIPRLTET